MRYLLQSSRHGKTSICTDRVLKRRRKAKSGILVGVSYLTSPYAPNNLHLASNNMLQNIVTTQDIRVRARMRRLLSPSCNLQSFRDQSPIMESFANKMINRRKEIYEKDEWRSRPVVVNMLDWINFFTVDIIEHLDSPYLNVNTYQFPFQAPPSTSSSFQQSPRGVNTKFGPS